MFKTRRFLAPLSIAVVLLSACYYYPPPPSAQWVDTSVGKAVAVGGPVREPKVVSRVNPVATNEPGVVQARVVIAPDGTVSAVEILSASSGANAQSAKNALSQWRFTRTYLDGTAVPVAHELKLTFK